MIKLKELLVKPSETYLQKNTNQDKVRQLRDAIDSAFEVGGCREYAYYEDHDDSYIYFSIWGCESNKYMQWAVAYTYNTDNGEVVLGEEAIKTVQMTEWKLLPETPTEMTEKSLFTWLDKYFTKKEVIKAFDDEQMISVEPIWRPAGEVDLHKDTINLEEIRKVVDNINQKIDKGTFQEGLFHLHKTESFKWQRAWVQEVDATLGETFVKAGTPLISAKFFNKKAWELKKSGKWLAPSFGGNGNKQELEDGHE